MDELNGELIKEAYAKFGLAYYESECIHRGLCILYALGTFESPFDYTKLRYEEKLAFAFSQTLGQIIGLVKNLLPEELYEQILLANEKRKFLAHRFWFEKIQLMFSNPGLCTMIDELSEYIDFFHRLDKKLQIFLEAKSKKFGIDEKVIQQEGSEIRRGKPWEPLSDITVPKKEETLVCVWDVPAQGGSTLVFQTADGNLWQLCDVGLGGTRFKEPEPSWKVNRRVQDYLPVKIRTRPEIESPWNFEFRLSNGAVLWVRRGKKEKTFKWGIRKRDDKISGSNK